MVTVTVVLGLRKSGHADKILTASQGQRGACLLPKRAGDNGAVKPVLRRLLPPIAGAVACLGLWAWLVWTAIPLVRTAPQEGGSACVWAIAAVLGAVLCAFLAIVLGMHAWKVRARGPRVKGGKRASTAVEQRPPSGGKRRR